MCGIIGILSDQPAAPRLVEALKRLEYRGYDSAGIALLEGGKLKRLRAPGKLSNLDAKVRELPLKAGVGIGHTRWATHGQPNETNAHPHASGRVAIVHNGIIENFRELREAMEARGRKFETETDSETIAHLIDENLGKGLKPKDAFKATLDQLRGAFAIAAIIEGEDNLILGGRRGSPLVIGVADKEMFLGSDALAVGPFGVGHRDQPFVDDLRVATGRGRGHRVSPGRSGGATGSCRPAPCVRAWRSSATAPRCGARSVRSPWGPRATSRPGSARRARPGRRPRSSDACSR